MRVILLSGWVTVGALMGFFFTTSVLEMLMAGKEHRVDALGMLMLGAIGLFIWSMVFVVLLAVPSS